MLETPEDLSRQYNYLDLPSLLERNGLETLLKRYGEDLVVKGYRGAVLGIGDQILNRLRSAASRVPKDPREVFEIIVKDRDEYNHGVRERTQDVNTKTAEAPKSRSKYGDDQKITLLKDAEGKKFGPKNNPKREGSKSHGRFAAYKDGMKVSKAIEAGVTKADLDYDVTKGFIEIN